MSNTQTEVNQIKQNKTPLFLKAKESAIKHLVKYYGYDGKKSIDEYDNKKIDKVVNLKDFPKSNEDLHRVDASAKAIIMKAQLKALYPETKFSIVKDHYASLVCRYVSGAYPFGLESIRKIYVNPGNSDSMTDYYDYDLHLLLVDEKSGNQHFYNNPEEAIQELDEMIQKKQTTQKDYYDKIISYLVELIGVKN